MKFLGLHIPVSRRIDGQELARYHAILPRSLWQEASEEFSALWAEQRAAYRRLYGGTSAPRLEEIPWEVCLAKSALVAPHASIQGELEDMPDFLEYQVKNGFVHVGEGDGDQKLMWRCRSQRSFPSHRDVNEVGSISGRFVMCE
eukprot:TRINITY_DN12410_c0_g3_i1.p2 TRINITY_DN12410_c0_g3~~TRINITY_DN12410_c0_g3_i1.p2  ORF type:complete len:144 (-),score=22.85 TRINITY_DN12410_c0_g3_i1:16-447(-)